MNIDLRPFLPPSAQETLTGARSSEAKFKDKGRGRRVSRKVQGQRLDRGGMKKGSFDSGIGLDHTSKAFGGTLIEHGRLS
jgi:hypothetical protein